MKLLSVDSLEEARKKILTVVGKPFAGGITVTIDEALGRVLERDTVASLMIPHFRRSTVDGYAVIAGDTWGAGENTPVFLEVIGEVEMGAETSLMLRPGTCAYVPTGGMLPEGSESMVMVEYCELFQDNQIAVYEGAAYGAHIIEAGEDVRTGDLLLQGGTKLEPGHIAALAAAGINEISVFRPLSLTIISTGDELVLPGRPRKGGQIYDINTSGIQALAVQYGLAVSRTEVVKDDERLITGAVRKGMQDSDIVVISGGSSQGKKDATRRILDHVSCPGVFTHGLALKPGKPTILAYDQASSTMLIGLPGHPVAAMMVFRLLIGWYLRHSQGTAEAFTIPASISSNLPGNSGRTTCQLVTLEKKGQGYTAKPVFGESGLISTLSKAHGYVELERNQEGIRAGEQIEVHLL